MAITDLRRLNLRQWITDKYGGQQSRFAEAASVNQGELSSLLKNKSSGEKKARKIGQAASMPDMWLDTPHDTDCAGTGPNNPKESRKMTAISVIPEILADIKAGKMVIITDAEDRENEDDLLMVAQFVTPEAINFMIKNARGLVRLPMEEQMVENLGLPMMTQEDGAQYGTNFTVSVEAAQGITVGISAADRVLTIQIVVSPSTKPEDIIQPGHIFPLHAQKDGVLVHAGYTEAGVDLVQMSGLISAAVICEIINDDGTMARMPELMKFAGTHGLKIGTITDLIEYRSRIKSLLEEMGDVPIQTPWGEFQQHVYANELSGEAHLALAKGKPSADTKTLVCVHEPFGAMDFIQPNPRHSRSLPDALQRIQQAGGGVVILMYRAEDSVTLFDRALPKDANQAYKWDSKSYDIGAQILANLNVKKLRVLGQPSSFTGPIGFGLEIAGFKER